MKFALKILIHRPEQLPNALPAILSGYHYHKFTFEYMLPVLKERERMAYTEEPAPQLTAHAPPELAGARRG